MHTLDDVRSLLGLVVSFDTARSCALFGLFLAAILGAGTWLASKLLPADERLALRALAALGLGLCAYVSGVFLLAHAHLVYPVTVVVLLVTLALLSALPSGDARSLWGEVWRSARLAVGRDRLVAMAVGGCLLVVFAAGVKPPSAVDEREYHWPAPVYWAEHHGFVESPYKLTNGPALMEVMDIGPASLSEPTIAHWLTTTTLLLLLAATFVVAGGSLLGPLGVLGIPLALVGASISYNDVPAAALLLAGIAVLSGARARAGAFERRALVLGGIFVAAALSTKAVVMAAIAPALLAILAYQYVRHTPRPWGAFRRWLVAVGAPVVVVGGIWLAHTSILTGAPIPHEPAARIVRHDSPLLKTGEAAGRIPTLEDVAVQPAMPLFTPIVGQREPWGGRTGLVLLLTVPALVLGIRARKTQGTPTLVLFVLAMAAVMTGGLVFVKTRFLLVAWCLLVGGTVVILRSRPFLRILFVVLALLGMADGLRVVVRPAI